MHAQNSSKGTNLKPIYNLELHIHTFANVRTQSSKLYTSLKCIPLEELYACIPLKLFATFSINTNLKQPFRVIFRFIIKFREIWTCWEKMVQIFEFSRKNLSDL